MSVEGIRPARRAYMLGVAAFGVSRVVSVLGGALSLFFLSAILEKEALGGYVLAIAVSTLAGVAGSLGLDRALLLRVSPMVHHAGRLKGAGLAARTAAVSFAGGSAVGLALWLGADGFRAFGAATAADWMPAMALAVPLLAMQTVSRAWLEANHRAEAANLTVGIADGARCALFAIVFAFGLGAFWVGAAVVAAAVAPLLVPAAYALGRRPVRAPRRLGPGDFAAGLRYMPMRLCMLGYRTLDIILVGVVLPAERTAEYAVASRLANFVEFGFLALLPNFQPRVRYHIARADRAAAEREYAGTQLCMLVFALAVTALLVQAGEWLLSIFGAFEGAYAPMLLLAAAHVFRVGFGPTVAWLTMRGELNAPLVLHVLGLGLLVALLPGFAAWAGIAGAASASVAGTVAVACLGAWITARRTGLVPVGPALGVLLVAQGAAVAGVAFGVLPREAGTLVLCAAIAWLLAARRGLILEWIGRTAGGKA